MPRSPGSAACTGSATPATARCAGWKPRHRSRRGGTPTASCATGTTCDRRPEGADVTSSPRLRPGASDQVTLDEGQSGPKVVTRRVDISMIGSPACGTDEFDPVAGCFVDV